MDLSHFWVIAVISNPVRYDQRVRLFKKFKRYAERFGINLCVAELAYGDRDFSIPEDKDFGGADKTIHFRVRTGDELWHKENLANAAVRHICTTVDPKAEMLCLVDADVSWKDDDWAIETWHQLQHHWVVQMFAQAIDFGPEDEILNVHNGFVYSYWQNGFRPPENSEGYGAFVTGGKVWHPGYAWAWRREAYDMVGEWFQLGILGSGDHHMSMGLIGEAETHAIHPRLSANYKSAVMTWQQRALRYIQKDIGFVNTTLFHEWHGKKVNRQYRERWAILVENKYDPATDVKPDAQGILQLVVEDDRQIRLRDEIRLYFRQRNEDSIDLDASDIKLK